MRRVFRQLSPLISSSRHSSGINTNPVISHPGFNFITNTLQRSRGFAKLTKPSTYYDNASDDDYGGTYGAVDFGNAVKSVALSQMEAAVEALPHVLAKLPTPATKRIPALNRMTFKIKGKERPFKKVAAVSVCCEQTLIITPYHLNIKKDLQEAINASKLDICIPWGYGDKKDMTAFIYPFTKEARQGHSRKVIKSSERVKHRIRRVRHKALETIKKSISKKKEKENLGLSVSGFTPEDAKKLEKEVDEMTKKYIMSVQDICKSEAKKVFEDHLRGMVLKMVRGQLTFQYGANYYC